MKKSKVARLNMLRTELAALEAEVGEEEQFAHYQMLGLPTTPGWYVDAHDNPARLSEGGWWDDGWGNGGQDYGYPEPPLRRLVEES